MKRLFGSVFMIFLICATLAACGREEGNSVADMVKSLAAVRGESYEAGEFTVSEAHGEIYHSAAILRHGKEIGNITIIEKDGKFKGAVIRSEFSGLYPEAFAIKILTDIGMSEKNIAMIKNDIIDTIELEQLKSLDLNGYRILGASMIEEETQETTFELHILSSNHVQGYKEGEVQSSSLLE